MFRTKLVLRFVLVLFALFILLQPFFTTFTAPDPYTQLIGIGLAALVVVPVAFVFVRRSYSVEHLYKFLLAMYAVLFSVFGLFIGQLFVIEGVSGLVVPYPNSILIGGIIQTMLLLVVYALAFHLVYRGGYGRLKARFA